MRIREAKPKDAKAVFALLDQLCSWRKCRKYPAKAFAAMLRPPNRIFVAEEKGRVIGMATLIIYHVPRYNRKGVIVDELVVDEGLRGMGIGKALMGRAESYAKKIKAHSIRVPSRTTRKQAHKFYKAIGYELNEYMFRKRL